MPQATLLSLPAEILIQILTLLFDKRGRIKPASPTAILLTCKHLHRLTLPIQHRNLKLYYPHTPKTALLHRTLHSNPTLHPLIRSLTLAFGRDSELTLVTAKDYAAAADVLSWSPAVHTLHIRGQGQVQLEDRVVYTGKRDLLQHALRHSPALQRVSVTGWTESPGYGFGMRFDCLMREDDEWDGFAANEADVLSGVMTDGTVPECQANREIELSVAFDESFEDDDDEDEEDDDEEGTALDDEFATFYTWLRDHPHALQRVVFGGIRLADEGMEFRATDFPNLNEVICPPFQLKEHYHAAFDPPAMAIDRLLGPAVRTLVWDLTSYDQQNGAYWNSFKKEDEQWLREFAGLAAERRAALRTIRIEFSPETWSANRHGGYPWDRMERLREDTGPLGIGVEFTPPAITREEYWQAVAAKEAFQKAIAARSRKCQLDIIRRE